MIAENWKLCYSCKMAGSLGAYECGVYKALSKHGKRFDIVAGTSIGAINAAIITSSI